MNSIQLCHCGEPLHYADLSVKEMVDDLIVKLGTHIDVIYGNKTYKVPRHYLALHGVKWELMDTYGFEVIINDS